MFGRNAAIVVILVFAGLAGCIEAESATPADAGGQAKVASGPAGFDETSGGIEGTVTDTELQPLAGALVGLLTKDPTQSIQVLTDEAGRFSMSHVTPGDQVVAASMLGYSSASKRVSVLAGSAVEVSMMLEKIAVLDETYSETVILKGLVNARMWRLSPQCMHFSSQIPVQTQYNTLAKTCGGQGGPDFGQPGFPDETVKETNPVTLIAELEWQAQSATTGKGFLLDLNAPNVTRGFGGSIDQASPYTWVKMQGKSPIHIRVDIPTSLQERNIPESDWYTYPDGEGCTAPGNGQKNCEWFVRIFGAYCDLSSNFGDDCFFTPVDFGLQLDQAVTLYFSHFHKEPAPDGFSALPDS